MFVYVSILLLKAEKVRNSTVRQDCGLTGRLKAAWCFGRALDDSFKDNRRRWRSQKLPAAVAAAAATAATAAAAVDEDQNLYTKRGFRTNCVLLLLAARGIDPDRTTRYLHNTC